MRRGGCLPGHDRLYEAFDIILGDTLFCAGAGDLGQVHPEFASKLANRRTRMGFGETGFVNSRQRCGCSCRTGRSWRRLGLWRRLRGGLSRRRLGLCGQLFGCSRNVIRRRICSGVENQNQAALGYLVAYRYFEIDDLPGHRRRHVHGRLIGFQRDQRILGGDLVARCHHDVHDLDIGEVTDVRNEYFLLCHALSRLSLCCGS
jgi:hypothetical protein